MKKKILVLLFFLTLNQAQSIETRIIHNIQNEIITNVDVEKESRYLITLNRELKNLNKNKLLDISKQSILREIIKKIELSKYFDLKSPADNVKDYLQNFYNTLNIKNETEFRQYLAGNDLTLEYVEKKITCNIVKLKFCNLLYFFQ